MRRTILIIAALGLAAAGCSSDSEPASQGGTDSAVIDIVATTPQVADFARNIGGDMVQVHDIIRPGVDPHEFEPAAGDLERLSSADVIVRNGAGFEEWFEPTIASASPSGTIVDASNGVELRTDDGQTDPHIWQNPQNAKLMAANIAEALRVAAPENAQAFDSRLASYTAELDALDAEIAARIDGLADKKLVTDHDALGYYIDRYGMTLVGSVVPSFDTNADLSSAQINDLVAEIRAQNVRAIFVEQSVSSRSADTIARESGARVVSGEEALYADTFGESEDVDSYIEVMRHNTNSIVTALA